jgi:hypothetical protein
MAMAQLKSDSEDEDEDEEKAVEKAEKNVKVSKKLKVFKKPAAHAADMSTSKSVDAQLVLVKKNLPFPIQKKKPIHFGTVTIYVDMKAHKWRVKPGKARRDEKIVQMGKEPRVAWSKVQQKVSEFLAEAA